MLLQVRAARCVTNPLVASFVLRRAGVAFAVGWAIMGLGGDAGETAAVMLLAAAVLIHTAGELWQAAAGFELSFSLADPAAHGQYQGVFGLGQGAATAVGPVLATGVVLALGLWGWVGIGAALAAAGFIVPSAVGGQGA